MDVDTFDTGAGSSADAPLVDPTFLVTAPADPKVANAVPHHEIYHLDRVGEDTWQVTNSVTYDKNP